MRPRSPATDENTHERAAAAREQALARVLAEHDGVARSSRSEHARAQLGVGLERFLRGEQRRASRPRCRSRRARRRRRRAPRRSRSGAPESQRARADDARARRAPRDRRRCARARPRRGRAGRARRRARPSRARRVRCRAVPPRSDGLHGAISEQAHRLRAAQPPLRIPLLAHREERGEPRLHRREVLGARERVLGRGRCARRPRSRAR